ncbi:MAG: oligosaccharide flippase family protein [Leptospiraceae bacterium]|nr:oligosaccharide flippase family protein [Leptospiraceae bacterium]MCP5497938.1 oligosaccharide flippase family protein [Leptospiraceae bacterium]
MAGIVNFLSRRQTALQLEKIEYGFFYSVLSFFSFLLAIFDLGFNQSVTILISKYNIFENL